MSLRVIQFIVARIYTEVRIVDNVKMLFFQIAVEIQNIFLLVKEVQIAIIVLELMILIIVPIVIILFVPPKLVILFLFRMLILCMSVCFALIFKIIDIVLQICNLVERSILQLKKKWLSGSCHNL